MVLREVLQTTLLAVFAFLVLQLSVQNFRVEGSSMNPTLREGERLLVNKVVYMNINVEPLARIIPPLRKREYTRVYLFDPPRAGDVIVFRFPLDPSRNFIKRVVAGPGDTVEIRNGMVIVEGKVLEEPYVRDVVSWTNLPRIELCEDGYYVLGELCEQDEYYVMGDNRVASNDSRDWGPISRENVIGKVLVTYWPLSRFREFLPSF